MVRKIVVLKIIRSIFGAKKPTNVMVGFFDSDGTNLGSQLMSARLFPEDIEEGQELAFTNSLPPQ